MNHIDRLATFKALEYTRSSPELLDAALRDPESVKQFNLKRIQFEAHSSLVERLESSCSILRVSKREFLEAALLDALGRADEKFDAVFLEATGQTFEEVYCAKEESN